MQHVYWQIIIRIVTIRTVWAYIRRTDNYSRGKITAQTMYILCNQRQPVCLHKVINVYCVSTIHYNLFLWTYQIYIEVGCRNCCLSDHQLVYRIWKEQTDSKKTNSEERQYTEHTVSAIRSFCKRTYTRYPGTSLKSLMTLRIDGSCRSYFSTWFWMSMNMPPYKSPGKGKINQVPWFTDEIRELVKERNHLWLNLHFPCVNFTSLPL